MYLGGLNINDDETPHCCPVILVYLNIDDGETPHCCPVILVGLNIDDGETPHCCPSYWSVRRVSKGMQLLIVLVG